MNSHFFAASRNDRVMKDTGNLRKYKRRGIIGKRPADANHLLQDFKMMFSRPNFSEFRELLSLNGNTLKRIDSADLAKAIKGKKLSEDEQALLEIAVSTINSERKHVVVYLAEKDAVIPQVERLFRNELIAAGMIIENTKVSYGGVITGLAFAAQLHTEGVTLKRGKGTYTVIVDTYDHLAAAYDYIVTETGEVIHDSIPGTVNITAHEILGHARTFFLKSCNQHEVGILTENLVLRLIDFDDSLKVRKVQRNGTDHGRKDDGGRSKIEGYASRLPGCISRVLGLSKL